MTKHPCKFCRNFLRKNKEPQGPSLRHSSKAIIFRQWKTTGRLFNLTFQSQLPISVNFLNKLNSNFLKSLYKFFDLRFVYYLFANN